MWSMRWFGDLASSLSSCGLRHMNLVSLPPVVGCPITKQGRLLTLPQKDALYAIFRVAKWTERPWVSGYDCALGIPLIPTNAVSRSPLRKRNTTTPIIFPSSTECPPFFGETGSSTSKEAFLCGIALSIVDYVPPYDGDPCPVRVRTSECTL
jgi:hypothetical protein